jgi:rare lipoprotein A
MMTTSPWRNAVRIVAISALLAPAIAACSTGNLGATVKRGAFTSKEYGVAVSPRVTSNPNPPKGGGRYMVGKPYTVKGKTYVPEANPAAYVASGGASWYGSDFHGRRTANGEIFSANAITGAHPTLPLPSYVRVTNQTNGRSVIVRVNDRGPYMSGRIMDLSHRAAEMLGYVNSGSTNIVAEYVGPAPLEGDDTRQLVASYSGPALPTTQFAYAGGGNIFDSVGSMFSGMFAYAGDSAGGAAAATSALASGAMLTPSVDNGITPIRFSLGTYVDRAQSLEIIERFAVLGAVDEDQATINGRLTTRLALSALKAGVDPQDAVNLANEMGLSQAVLY